MISKQKKDSNVAKIGIITADLKINQTGLGNYVFGIINTLKDFEEIYQIHHKNGEKNKDCTTITPYYPPIPYWYFIWSQLLQFNQKELLKCDLIHNAIQYPIPATVSSRYIITIHDLIPILFPKMVTPFYAFQSRCFLPDILQKSTRIIAVSKNTKKDIVSCFQIDPEKIDVIYHGISNHFHIPDPQKTIEFKKRYNLNFPYILFVGALEPKKNIPNLIKAFYQCLRVDPSIRLVIAGKKSWKYDEIFSTIQKLNLKDRVIYLDFFPYEDLPYLYNGAIVFVFPSSYEGFGFPPLEAMKCGTPVIVSNSSSLPEVVGNEGLIVDPENIENLSYLILKVIADQNFREKKIAYYSNRIKLFTWDKSIKEHLNTYQKALSD